MKRKWKYEKNSGTWLVFVVIANAIHADSLADNNEKKKKCWKRRWNAFFHIFHFTVFFFSVLSLVIRVLLLLIFFIPVKSIIIFAMTLETIRCGLPSFAWNCHIAQHTKSNRMKLNWIEVKCTLYHHHHNVINHLSFFFLIRNTCKEKMEKKWE